MTAPADYPRGSCVSKSGYTLGRERTLCVGEKSSWHKVMMKE